VGRKCYDFVKVTNVEDNYDNKSRDFFCPYFPEQTNY